MNRDQFNHLKRVLKPGIGLVRDPRHPEPFLAEIPFLGLDKNVSDDEVLDRLSDFLDRLYCKAEAGRVREALRHHRGILAPAVALLAARTSTNAGRTESQTQDSGPMPATITNEEHQPSSSDTLEEALRPLQFQLARKGPLLPQTQLLTECGIKSGSRQLKIKKVLLANDLIKVHVLPKGKTNLTFWEPTAKALELLGVDRPDHAPNPGFMHSVVSDHAENYAKTRGYRVYREWLLSNGRRVDLMLCKIDSAEKVFLEIGMCSAKNELANVVNDLSAEQRPDKLVVACKNSSMKKQLEKLISTQTAVEQYQGKIQVVLAGDFVLTKS